MISNYHEQNSDKINDKTETEVGALLSADMKEEKYYTDKINNEMRSPRYRGFVEANMEYERHPLTGPIGIKDPHVRRKPQSLVKGQPVRNSHDSDSKTDELQYSGEKGIVKKDVDHANLARSRVQQKTHKEMSKIQRAHRDMNDYLERYNRQKEYKKQQAEDEKVADFEQLKAYDPFGKPGGGAPVKSKSGRDLPHLANDFEIRFRDDDYHKKMVECGNRYRNNPREQKQYSDSLQDQLKERELSKSIERQKNKEDDAKYLNFNPYGKPGGGAARSDDQLRHWSRLQPAVSNSTLNEKRTRLQLQAKENFSRAHEEGGRQSSNKLKRKKAIEEANLYNPWGKGVGNPKYDSQGNVSVRFGMKTHYDIFNKFPIISTQSGITLSGWPLPASATGDGIHSDGSPSQTHRSGLLSRRHGQNFVTEKSSTEPPLLNGRETVITDGHTRPQKHQGQLTRVHNQSIVAPVHQTDNVQHVSKPSAGTLKRELDQANKSLNLQVNENYDRLAPVPSLSQGDSIDQEASQNIPSPKNRQSIDNQSKDVADWMRSTAVGQPQRDPISGFIRPTRRITSDVTRHRLDLRTPKNAIAYHQELAQQIEERNERDRIQRDLERKQEKNWDQNLFKNFGKPGGGAPHLHGCIRRQFSNPSMVPQLQVGTHIPEAKYGNINSHIGGKGHGAPNDDAHRHVFSNAAIVPAAQLGTGVPKIVGDKRTTVASLLNFK